MKRYADSPHYTQVGRGRTVLAEQIKLTLTLTLTGCLLLALETTLFARLFPPFLGMGRAAPSMGILFCMAAGFLYGERVGGGYGLFLGFLSDCMDYASGETAVMILPLLYFLFGYLSGMVGKRRLAHNLPSFVVFAIIGGGLECLFEIGRAALRIGTLPPLPWIYQGLLPIWILTVLLSPAVYGILWLERWLLGRRRGR